MSNVDSGAWTNFTNPLTPDAKQVFKHVSNTGVTYTPFAFATRVVAGTNYCFVCTSTLVAPSQTQGAAQVYVFQPLPG